MNLIADSGFPFPFGLICRRVVGLAFYHWQSGAGAKPKWMRRTYVCTSHVHVFCALAWNFWQLPRRSSVRNVYSFRQSLSSLEDVLECKSKKFLLVLISPLQRVSTFCVAMSSLIGNCVKRISLVVVTCLWHQTQKSREPDTTTFNKGTTLTPHTLGGRLMPLPLTCMSIYS